MRGQAHSTQRKRDRAKARRRRRQLKSRLLVVAAIAFAAGLTFAAVGYSGARAPVLPRDAIPVEIGGSPSGSPIAPGFVGFSLEYPTVPAYAGSNPSAPNSVFIRLVRALNPNQSPVIRIGGDTTDWTWWPTAGAVKPAGVRYALTQRWLAVTRATALALGARLILGINLEADNARVAAAEAHALLRGLGRRLIAGFELGNEPEVYGAIAWYTNSAGVGVRGRPRSYDFQSYLTDYATIAAALPHGVPLAGPTSGAPQWLASTGQFLAANPRVRLVTAHVYPLRRCRVSATSPQYPTIAHLLSPAASAGAASWLAPAIAAAHARGIGLRVDELNSVACKGKRGVSNTFASALWVVDSLFHLAQAGISGVNIHTLSKSHYQPFTFTHSDGQWRAHVNPLYYGLLLFTQAAPAGSRLLPTSQPSNPDLRSWATRGPDGTVRVVLINTSARYPSVLAVRPPRPARFAVLSRLRAPSLQSTTGVTLGGQTFGASTTTGTFPGQKSVRLQLVQGRYVVRLAAGSAALLTLRPQ